MMDINNIILSLSQRGIFLDYSEDLGLRVFGSNQDDVESIQLIRENKELLINYLNQTSYFVGQIKKVENEFSYSLSSAQRRLWVLSKFEGANEAYNIPQVVRLEGSINESAFNSAFNNLLQRHEVLRTVFSEDEQGNPRQRILPITDERFSIHIKDYNTVAEQGLITEQQRIESIQDYVQQEIATGFDLEQGPLIRCSLLKETESSYVWILVMHHIVSDGWSMGVLHKEFSELYNAALEQRSPALEPLSIQYKDYAAWHNSQLQSEEINTHKNYWLEQFKGELPVLELPSDNPRQKVMTYNGSSIYKELDKKLTDQLKSFSQEQGGTLFMTLQTALNILLHKYTGQEDIVIGSPIAGREHPDLEGQIGFYINTLALRTQFSKEDTVEVLYKTIKQNTLGAYSHQVYPYDELVDDLKLTRDMSRNPLFDVMLVLQNVSDGIEMLDFMDLNIEEYTLKITETAKVDLSFYIIENIHGIRIILNYNTDIYSKDQVKRMLTHLEQLLHTIPTYAQTAIKNYNIITQEEKTYLLETINDTATDYPKDKTIVDLFEEQVAKTPDNIAIKFKDTELTYRELNEKSNQLAHYLINKYNIQADDLVGIELERSEWMVIGILAIIKSGGAYVPIDPEYPEQRKAFIQEDSSMLLYFVKETITDFEKVCDSITKVSPLVTISGNNLVYCTYTSGSTGLAKGVAIEHNQLSLFITLNKNYFFKNITENSKTNWFAVTNYTFDISVFELLGSLLYGFTLNLNPIGNAEYLLNSILDNPKGILQITPSYFEELIEHEKAISILPSLSVIMIGGEAMSEKVVLFVENYLSSNSVFNVYGPTETTIWSSAFQLNNSKRVFLGKPLDNEFIYLLNSDLDLALYGSIGEICIRGVGLARGYLNREELTKEKFITNPYKPSERLYRTGDLGRWREDGNLEYLGRMDDQVKIRGYRIELGEIEQSLSSHKSSGQVVVIARAIQNTSDKELIAYTTGEVTAEELKVYLKEKLPSYMVPNYYVKLENIPLTSNGKVDRKALPDPDGTGMQGAEYVAPRTEIEKQLVKIWSTVLGLEESTLNIRADFFDLGGHSIKAIRLLGQVHKQLGVKIALKELFTHPTIEQISKLIKASSAQEDYTSIPKTAEQEDYAVSSAQRRLWVLSKFDGANEAYNIPQVVRLEGSINEFAFSSAYNNLLQRHEVLRTVFSEDEQGNPRQRVLPITDNRFNIQILDYIHQSKEVREENINLYVSKEISSGFSLEQGPLIRCSLLKETENSYVWVLVMHHIVSDGWSMGVLHKEFSELYNAALEQRSPKLEPLSIQYKDYAAWHNAQLDAVDIKIHKEYWLEQFKGELSVLELPSDNPRPKVMTYNGSSIYKELDKKLTDQLKSFSQEQGGTLFMTLQTALNILLHKYTGQEDIVIGSPIAGREHPDLEGQIGFYLGALPIRTTFSKEETVTELYQKIRQNTIGAYSHQVYPYDELVDALNLTRDTSRNPLFDVWLDYHSQEIESEGITFKGVGIDEYALTERNNHQTKFDLTLVVKQIDGDKLVIYCEYCKDTLTNIQVRKMLNNFEILLRNLNDNCSKKLKSIEILTEEEKIYLLESLNNMNTSYSKNKTVVDLFEEQVKIIPNSIAVKYKKTELTYKELNEKSNQLAHYLINNYQIQPDDLVGIELERSEWMVIGILAIIKSGGAYVPIDPEYPEQRKVNIYDQISCKVMIDQDFIDEFLMERSLYSSSNPQINIKLNSLVYCLFTSGSTGKPKGVLIEHGMLANSTLSRTIVYEDIHKKGLMLYSFSFDSSINLTFRLLTTGGELFIYDSSKVDLSRVNDIIGEELINTLTIPPSVYESLLTYNNLSSLKCIIVAGEECKSKVLSKHFEVLPNAKLYNEYGPTECVVWCTYKLFESRNDKITIGKPVPSYEILLLEKEGTKLVPYGSVGEICVGGFSVGRGYLNDNELTNKKFIEHPYRFGQRLYRTGDFGKWDLDMNLEFLGRVDNQLKIRGYRVELKEIEQALLEFQNIEEAIVVFSKKQVEEGQIIAYLKAKNQEVDLLQKMRGKLPDYMLPNAIVWIDKVPLTEHLKIDYNQLPSPLEVQKKEIISPSNKTEKIIAEIWSAILTINKESICVKDHFFDAGGHSIKAIRLLASIYKKFGKKIEISFLFEHGTIESIAQLIDFHNESPIEDGYSEIKI